MARLALCHGWALTKASARHGAEKSYHNDTVMCRLFRCQSDRYRATGDYTRPRTRPWAMQLVLLRDKHHPARQVDACEAAARAVVFLLDDPRTQPGGPWHDAVRQWSNKRIRKIVRRASGKRWDDVQVLDGVTISQDPPRMPVPKLVQPGYGPSFQPRCTRSPSRSTNFRSPAPICRPTAILPLPNPLSR